MALSTIAAFTPLRGTLPSLSSLQSFGDGEIGRKYWVENLKISSSLGYFFDLEESIDNIEKVLGPADEVELQPLSTKAYIYHNESITISTYGSSGIRSIHFFFVSDWDRDGLLEATDLTEVDFGAVNIKKAMTLVEIEREIKKSGLVYERSESRSHTKVRFVLNSRVITLTFSKAQGDYCSVIQYSW